MGKRYLMRASMSPLDNPTAAEAIGSDLIWGNTGNLLFFQSVYRALLTDSETIIDCIDVDREYDRSQAEEINEKYDAFIVPLANAFRKSFARGLSYLTSLIEKLSIPVIVIGVGYQGGLREDITASRSWDEGVRRFCKAVLKHSAGIGIRGEITASYLKHLGFRQEQDFTVIGCPSLFTYGKQLPQPKEPTIGPGLKVNFSCSVTLKNDYHKLFGRLRKEFADYYYIPQNTYELQSLYCGLELAESCPFIREVPADYIGRQDGQAYLENRVRGFFTAASWLGFLQERDMNIGTRIHGSIAGVLAGLPVFVIPPDTRVMELVTYHELPHALLEEIALDKPFSELLEKIDFTQIRRNHPERFERYHGFLKASGLETIYDFGMEEAGKAPLDALMAKVNYAGAVVPFRWASVEEQQRVIAYWNSLYKQAQQARPLQSISDLVKEKRLSFSSLAREGLEVTKYLITRKR